MKIDFKGGLIVLLFLALCLTNIIQCNEEKRIPTTDIPYHTLDSLGRVISALENYAIKQERLIDSLKANTNKIIIKYETDIKNFSDVYVVSDQPLDNIFTRDITLILEAVLLGSVVYLIICISEAKYKVKKVQDSYDALKTNYSSLLTSEDIAQAFGNDKLITKMVNEVNRGIIRYSLLWGLFILFFLVAIEIISTEPFVTPLLQHLFTTIKNILLQTTCN